MPNVARRVGMDGKINLQKLFRHRPIIDMHTLQRLCKGRSKRSLFRDLSSLGYFSSYSHAGKYYTLTNIPNFDDHGLWHYKDISFSENGTLKSTIGFLVDDSMLGFTHRELTMLLRVRVQNTLNNLTANSAISRERLGNVFLYISADKKEGALQITQRKKQIDGTYQIQPLDPHTTIEVLLELLRSDDWHPRKISNHLQSRGFPVKKVQVEEVLSMYNLKKNPSN
jgi:hypothetical protein